MPISGGYLIFCQILRSLPSLGAWIETVEIRDKHTVDKWSFCHFRRQNVALSFICRHYLYFVGEIFNYFRHILI